MNINNQIGLSLVVLGTVVYFADKLISYEDNAFPLMIVSSGITILTKELIEDNDL